MTTDTYSSAGVTDWVVPAGVYSLQIECEGSGAPGAGRAASALANGGGGGGGGAYSKTNALPVFPGQTIRISVGAAGAKGAAGDNAGTIGGDTWVSTTTVAPTSTSEGCLAKAGSLATGAPPTTGGVGGATASGIGDTKTAGQNGVNGGTAAQGGKGGDGAAPLGGAGGPLVNTGGTNGNNGTAPGGAGSGGRSAAGVNVTGGDGSVGRAVLTYTVVPSSAFLGLI